MRKTILYLLLSLVSFSFAEIIKSYGVDGSSHNVNVVIDNRDPIVFFKYDDNYTILFFEIKISSTQEGLSLGNTIWYVLKTTSSENTLNFITRVPINRQVLTYATSYFLSIAVYETKGGSETVCDMFCISSSAIREFAPKISLEIDQNNPFCPSQGETTKIRYKVDKDIPISVHIFSASGKFIRTLKEKQEVLKDMVYTIDWDGKDSNGNVLPQGVYLVVLYSEGINPVTRLVAIVDKR